MHVAFNPFGIVQDFAADRVTAEKLLQPITNGPILGPVNQPLIEYHSHTDITAFERDAPGPPAMADEMICRCATDAKTRFGPHRIFARQFVAVPILDPTPAGPGGGSGMIGVWAPPVISTGN